MPCPAPLELGAPTCSVRPSLHYAAAASAVYVALPFTLAGGRRSGDLVKVEWTTRAGWSSFRWIAPFPNTNIPQHLEGRPSDSSYLADLALTVASLARILMLQV